MENKAVSFIMGLVFSIVLGGVVYYFLFIETLDLFGIEPLKDPENRDGKIFFTGLITSMSTIGLAAILLFMKRKSTAIGFALPSVIGLILMLNVGPTFFNKSNYYEEFEERKWRTHKHDRIKMARHLVKTKALIGMTKDQVITKLGREDFFQEKMNYFVYQDFCGLGIRLENDRVVDYGIWVEDRRYFML